MFFPPLPSPMPFQYNQFMSDDRLLRQRRVPLLACLLGITSIMSQILLLRELITVFYGNEMAYAVILASWLFWVSVGSYAISRLTSITRRPLTLVFLFQILVALILPAAIILSRNIHAFLNVAPGGVIGIVPMSVSSFILLAPLTFILGGMFSVLCSLWTDVRMAEGASRHAVSVYLWESAGAAAGGILFTFIFIRFFSSLTSACIVGFIQVACLVFFGYRRKCVFRTGVALSILIILALVTGAVSRIDRWSRGLQWKGFEVVAVADSLYGNLTLVKRGPEYSLYENGLISYSTRDALTNEENAHFALLAHEDPHRVLLIGGGVGGTLGEILKHPVAKVDYIELDPMVIDISRRYLPSRYTEELTDRRVAVHHIDGRLFVKRSLQSYDVVIVNLADPMTALINRYYTLEFFREVRGILSGNGIIALSVSSSENYLNQEAQDFLRSIHTTLRSVFTEVKSVPGDTHIFLASPQNGTINLAPARLSRRLKARRIQTAFVSEYYLPFKLSADRLAYVERILGRDGVLNTDMRPVTYLFNITLWTTHFNTIFKDIMGYLEDLRFIHLSLVGLLIIGAGYEVKRRRPRAPVTLSIVTTGFSEIVFQVIVILAFQTLYGYAYYKIGWIMTSFMAGLCLGSWTARRFISCPDHKIQGIYRLAQVAICLYPLILPWVFVAFRDPVGSGRASVAFATTFACLPVIAGVIGGIQYPLALQLLRSGNRKDQGNYSGAAGFLYAADVLGATLGALITGMILIPLLGIAAVAGWCALINTSVLILLLLPVRKPSGTIQPAR